MHPHRHHHHQHPNNEAEIAPMSPYGNSYAGGYGQDAASQFSVPAAYGKQQEYVGGGYGSGPYYNAGSYQDSGYPSSGYSGAPGMYQGERAQMQRLEAEEHRHRQDEHRAALGAIGAAALAHVNNTLLFLLLSRVFS